MTSNSNMAFQALIDRILAGDAAARRELLNRAGDRLRLLAGRMLNESFPALRNRHELDSVVHETWLRLVQTVEKTNPPTVADFFRLAAHKIRHVLLDMSERHRRQLERERLGLGASSTSLDGVQPSHDTFDPSRLASWTEFHNKVATLADDERAVFEMHYYLELPQAEIAKVLNVHPRRVSYMWIAATDKLADELEVLGVANPAE